MTIRKLAILATGWAIAMALAGCSSGYAYHDSLKFQAAGVNMSPSTGATAGYLSGTLDRAANVDKNGAAITVPGGCKADTPDTYANLNSKASAQATSIAPASAAAAAAGGVSQPQIAWASGDTTAGGGAALIAAAATTAHPADTLAAYCLNAQLPSAPAGAIVRDGVSPVAAAPASSAPAAH